MQKLLSVLVVFYLAAFNNVQAKSIQELRALYESDVYKGPMVVAHRGCWTAAPENSILSLENCIDLGVEVAEIDVQLTSDRKLILMHDKTLDRTTNGSGKVYETSLAEISQLNLMERDGAPNHILKTPVLTSERVPTLAEVFEAIDGKLMLNLEIKFNEKYTFFDVFEAAVELSKKMGVEDHILWKIKPLTDQTGALDLTAYDRVFNSGITYMKPIVWNSSNETFLDKIELLSKYNLLGFEIITPDLDYWPLDVNGKIIGNDNYVYMGIPLLPIWSGGLTDRHALVSPESNWGKLHDMGIKLIMTDRPEQLLQYINRL